MSCSDSINQRPWMDRHENACKQSDQTEQGYQGQVDIQSSSGPGVEKWEPQNDISHSERGNRYHHRQFFLYMLKAEVVEFGDTSESICSVAMPLYRSVYHVTPIKLRINVLFLG